MLSVTGVEKRKAREEEGTYIYKEIFCFKYCCCGKKTKRFEEY
jgi:hypothetical protein